MKKTAEKKEPEATLGKCIRCGGHGRIEYYPAWKYCEYRVICVRRVNMRTWCGADTAWFMTKLEAQEAWNASCEISQ